MSAGTWVPAVDPCLRCLSYFAHAIQGWVVAEGIETEEERQALVGLGVALGQGYLFGRPADVDTWAALGPAA